MRRRRKTSRKTGSRAPQLRKQTDRATPASTWRSSILEHDENLIPEESNETREKGIYRTFSENKVFEIFRDMASDYGNPKPSLFASEHLSPQSEGGCERTVANRAALHCGWHGLRLSGKGLIAPGMDADIDVFTLEGLHEAGTYQQPRQLAQGMEHVFVAGEPAILHGKRRPSFCGKVLERVKF